MIARKCQRFNKRMREPGSHSCVAMRIYSVGDSEIARKQSCDKKPKENSACRPRPEDQIRGADFSASCNRVQAISSSEGANQSPQAGRRRVNNATFRLYWGTLVPVNSRYVSAPYANNGSDETDLLVSSAARHAFRVFDVGPGIANEHVAIRHLDRGKRLGIKRRIGRQQTVEAEDVGGDRIDVVVA
jgi:hypothetical protein